MRRSRVALGAAVAALGFALGGCLGGAPRDRFYRLEVPEPALRFEAPVLPGTIEVDPPRADVLVRGRPILHTEGPGSVEVVPHRYHLWVDSPTLAIQRALVADLDARGIAERVVGPEMRIAEDWLVFGRLARLEHHPLTIGRGVVVELELGLTATDRGRLVFFATYREEGTASDDVEASAKAMGQALGRIFERFAADLAEVAATL